LLIVILILLRRRGVVFSALPQPDDGDETSRKDFTEVGLSPRLFQQSEVGMSPRLFQQSDYRSEDGVSPRSDQDGLSPRIGKIDKKTEKPENAEKTEKPAKFEIKQKAPPIIIARQKSEKNVNKQTSTKRPRRISQETTIIQVEKMLQAELGKTGSVQPVREKKSTMKLVLPLQPVTPLKPGIPSFKQTCPEGNETEMKTFKIKENSDGVSDGESRGSEESSDASSGEVKTPLLRSVPNTPRDIQIPKTPRFDDERLSATNTPRAEKPLPSPRGGEKKVSTPQLALKLGKVDKSLPTTPLLTPRTEKEKKSSTPSSPRNRKGGEVKEFCDE